MSGRDTPPISLKRSLGVVGVLFLTLSVATPASSLFVIVPGMVKVAGTGAVWAMALAGVVCVATAFIYAELSSIWPIAGGEYVAVERTLGPLAGFVMLGINVFNNLVFLPVAGLGVSAVLASVIPGLPPVPVAIGVVSAATLIAVLDIRINAVITGIFLSVELLAIAAVVALGLAHPRADALSTLLHPAVLGAQGLTAASPAAIGLASTIALFALNGYGAAVYFAEEMHDAPRRIARAILWALAITFLLEFLPLLALAVGAPDLRAAMASDDPFGLLVATLGGTQAAQWVSIGVVIAILNALIAWAAACARFLYSSGRDGSWGRPVDLWLTRISPRFGSPWLGTLIVGAVGVACCFVPLQLLLVLSGTGLIAIYAGIALATIAARRSGASDAAPYRMPLYPLAPVVTLLALGYVAWTSWQDPLQGRIGLIATGAQMAVSAGYYRLVLRRRRRLAGANACHGCSLGNQRPCEVLGAKQSEKRTCVS